MVVHTELEGPTAWVVIDNPPVNATSQAVRAGLIAALEAAESHPEIRAVVLCGAGRGFVAGADIKEFDAPPAAPILPDVLMAIEGAAKPWVAAIHGVALGGGLELAMACHGRVASTDARLGLPEVTLGIIPGAGGTVRLPRLMAAERALEMIAGGRPVSARAALASGLVDRIAEDALIEEATDLALTLSREPVVPTLARPCRPAVSAEAFRAVGTRLTARSRGQVAPLAAIAAVERALQEPATTALAAERETFLELKAGPQSAALRYLFAAERRAPKMPEIDSSRSLPLDGVGIVGGGTMGAGIAAACLLRGVPVSLFERDKDAARSARERTEKVLKGALERGRIGAAEHVAALETLKVSIEIGTLSKANLIIEAVHEDLDVKREVFARLDVVAHPEAVLATNTSYLDVTEIAKAVEDPSRVIGLHFFAPAYVMRLLEMVVSDAASSTAIATGLALARRLGKVAVPSKVCEGFVANRIMSSYRREADRLIGEGALPWDVDNAMRRFGYPMGVFEMQDLSGLDIAWSMRRRRAARQPAEERPVAIADRLCEAGRFGRKTGRGWYNYASGKAMPDPDVEALIEAESRSRGIVRCTFSDGQIMERILGAMQRESHAVLSEGIARRASDIDVAMVLGYGFPRWRGGPMFMAAGNP